MKKPRINITIRAELLRQLDDYCIKSGYNRSLVIFLALRKYFETLKEESVI